MTRFQLTVCGLVLAFSSTSARAQARMPKTGEMMSLVPADFPKLAWSFGTPSQNDAAGKVVVHWFCTPKVEACVDDLARIVTHRDNGGVYVIGYINASARHAKKLDPIRESEGVGRGAIATGPGVKKLFKDLGIAKGPWSIVVDVDGTVKAVTTSPDLNELDARDTLIKELVAAVKPYKASSSGPKLAKPGEKLTFSMKIELASWQSFSTKTPTELTLTAAKELSCNARSLKAEQIKIEGKTLTAEVTCTAPKGVYEARGDLRFGYVSSSGATGLGAETAQWKFEVRAPAVSLPPMPAPAPTPTPTPNPTPMPAK